MDEDDIPPESYIRRWHLERSPAVNEAVALDEEHVIELESGPDWYDLADLTIKAVIAVAAVALAF